MELIYHFISHFRGVQVVWTFVVEVEDWFSSLHYNKLYESQVIALYVYFFEPRIAVFIVLEVPFEALRRLPAYVSQQLLNPFLLLWVRNNVHILVVNHTHSVFEVILSKLAYNDVEVDVL